MAAPFPTGGPMRRQLGVVIGLLALVASLAAPRPARGAPCFATDGDGIYDQDGAVDGVVTIDSASASIVTPAATPYDCTGVAFHIESGGTLEFARDSATGAIVDVRFGTLTIDAGGVIEADGQGCPGGSDGADGAAPDATNVCVTGGAGAGIGGQGGGRSGGGHGGAGGSGSSGDPGGAAYGSATGAILDSAAGALLFGAGGGGTSALDPDGPTTGGAGGGVIRLDVSGLFTQDGIIRANGTDGGTTGGGAAAGGGGGGFIFVRAPNVAGSGTFEARGGNGGAGSTASGGGGGGGRIIFVHCGGPLPFNGGAFDVSGGGGPDDAIDGDPGSLALGEGGCCADGLDNDADDETDCVDPDCAADPACTPTTTSSTSTTTSTLESTTTTTAASTTTTTAIATTTTTSHTTTTRRTTSTSTTSSTSTTTSTFPPGSCEVAPVGPTFLSLDCRLSALIDHLNVDPTLTAVAARLIDSLSRATVRRDQSERFCAASKPRPAQNRLQQAIRKLAQYAHRLAGPGARRTLSDATRQELLDAGGAIQADAQTLRNTLSCPADAAQP